MPKVTTQIEVQGDNITLSFKTDTSGSGDRAYPSTLTLRSNQSEATFSFAGSLEFDEFRMAIEVMAHELRKRK